MKVNLIFPHHLSVFYQIAIGIDVAFMLNSFVVVVVEKCFILCALGIENVIKYILLNYV